MTPSPEEPLSREECFRILELYRHWNVAQRGDAVENAVLDARRALIVAATKRLTKLAREVAALE